jgi:hypothetical protein
MYYAIKNRTDEEVGSVYPQVNCITQEQAHNLYANEFPSYDPELIFELNKNAKLTDVLSQAAISAQGLLVSDRMKSVLENHAIMKHRYYPVTIKMKNENFTYYWLHLNDDFTGYIDYKQTEFYWTKSTFRKGNIQLSNFQEYLQKKQENGRLWDVSIDKLKLADNFDNSLNLVSFFPFDLKIYVSSNLKIILSNEQITGLNISQEPI